MTRRTSRKPIRLWAAGLVVTMVHLAAPTAFPMHGTPPPPPPPGHGQLLVRLVPPPGVQGGLPDGQVRVEAIELRRAGAGPDGWMRLPLVRTAFSPTDLRAGQVWVVDVPLPAGAFDQVRVNAGGTSQIVVALRLIPGKWSILSLEVGFQPGRGQGALRLTVSQARTEGPY